MDITNVGSQTQGLAKSLQMQKLGASVIDKTLSKVKDVQNASNNQSNTPKVENLGKNIDITV